MPRMYTGIGDSPSENGIKRLTPRRDLDDTLTQVSELMRSLETSSRRLCCVSVIDTQVLGGCCDVPGI